MYSAFLKLIDPVRLFDPVGIPLGNVASSFILLFGAIFLAGLVIRLIPVFSHSLNPYLRRYLQSLAFLLMFWGVAEVIYFLVREQRVAYLTANILFVVMTLCFLLWLVYSLVYRYGIVYRRDHVMYELQKEHSRFLPRKKK